jgi:phospholipase C
MDGFGPDQLPVINTLLLAAFDEHGGNFDHVRPPAAVLPYNPQPGGAFGPG